MRTGVPYSLLAAVLVLSVSAPSASTAEPTTKATSRPAVSAESRKSFDSFLSILHRSSLELSTGPGSVADRFYFVLDAAQIKDKVAVPAFSIVVARDGARSAYLIRYADGLPYAYASNNLFAILDAGKHELSTFDKGVPQFFFYRVNGEIDFEMGVWEREKTTGIKLDPVSILDAGADLRFVTYDTATRTFWTQTEKSDFFLQLTMPQDKSEYPIHHLLSRNHDGKEVRLHSFIINGDPLLKMFDVTRAQLEATGLTIKSLDATQVKAVMLLPNTSSLAPERERKAAFDFGEVFAIKKHSNPQGAPVAPSR